MIEPGRIAIRAERRNDRLTIVVEDSAGLYKPSPGSDGMGMSLVDRRIKIRYGETFGVAVACESDCWTRVTISLPAEEEEMAC